MREPPFLMILQHRCDLLSEIRSRSRHTKTTFFNNNQQNRKTYAYNAYDLPAQLGFISITHKAIIKNIVGATFVTTQMSLNVLYILIKVTITHKKKQKRQDIMHGHESMISITETANRLPLAS